MLLTLATILIVGVFLAAAWAIAGYALNNRRAPGKPLKVEDWPPKEVTEVYEGKEVPF